MCISVSQALSHHDLDAFHIATTPGPNNLLNRVCGYLCDRGMSRMRAAAAGFFLAGALIAPAAVMTRAGSVALAWLAHAVFLVLVGWIGGLLAVSMCPLYPTEGARGRTRMCTHSRGARVLGARRQLLAWTTLLG
jgi:hypothetical protein